MLWEQVQQQSDNDSKFLFEINTTAAQICLFVDSNPTENLLWERSCINKQKKMAISYKSSLRRVKEKMN